MNHTPALTAGPAAVNLGPGQRLALLCERMFERAAALVRVESGKCACSGC